MAWISQRGKWDWRKFLNSEEAAFIREADSERAKIERMLSAWQKKYGLKRTKTVNRAIQRAKFEATP